jgi:hypothetical protein
MKRIINIFIVLLTIVFLLPSAGFYFIRHTCLRTGDSMVVWNRESDCCNDQTGISMCCELSNYEADPANNTLFSDTHKQCCSNVDYYIKDISLYDLLNGVKIKPLSYLSFATPVIYTYGIDDHTIKHLLIHRISPDKAESQKSVFLMNSSLIL